MSNDDTTDCVLRVYCDKGLEMRRLLKQGAENFPHTTLFHFYLTYVIFIRGQLENVQNGCVHVLVYASQESNKVCVCVCVRWNKREIVIRV